MYEYTCEFRVACSNSYAFSKSCHTKKKKNKHVYAHVYFLVCKKSTCLLRVKISLREVRVGVQRKSKRVLACH